jgi:hypothetical protein
MSTTPELSANFSGLTNEINRVFSVMSGKTPVLTGPPGPIGVTGPTGPIGSTGPSGATGIGIGTTVKGDWVSGSGVYSTNGGTSPDAVTYNGSLYVCIQAVSSSIITPDQDPTNWLLYISKGVTGPTGPQAVTGPTGFMGATGIGIGTTLQGNWTYNATYRSRSGVNADMVTYQGSTYVCIQATAFVSTIPPSQDPTNWLLYVQMGATGSTGPLGTTGPIGIGIGTTLQGTWSNINPYSVNSGTNPDAVTYNGSLYVCQANVGATGPLATPDTDSIHWLLYVQKGATGPVGAIGPSGATGSVPGFLYRPTGPTGPLGGPTGPYPNPTVQASAYILPSVDATYDIGATGIQFKDVFFSGDLYQAGRKFVGGGGGGGGNTFMIAGGSGTNKLAYTNDGITWLPDISGNAMFSSYCGAVAWNGAIWVAVGSDTSKGVAYSSDGILWNAATTPFDTTPLMAVAWNGSIWLAGGNSGLMYSYNGINWTVSTSYSAFGVRCTTIAWNGLLWVAGGFNGTNRVAYSYDGITWTPSITGYGVFLQLCKQIIWNGTVFVGVGSVGTNQPAIGYSYDGIKWSNFNPDLLSTPSAYFSNYAVIQTNTVTWNGSYWLIGCQQYSNPNIPYQGLILKSSDGIIWTVFGNATIFYNVNTLAWNGSVFVAGGTAKPSGLSGLIAYSYDGITWIQSTSGSSLINYNSALASRQVLPFVGLGNSQVGLKYSASGPTGPTGGTTGPTGPWLQVSASILPTQDLTYDLGATGLRFRDIHLGGSTIYLGDSVTLSATSDGTLSAKNLTGTVSLLTPTGLNGGTLAGVGTTTVSESSNFYGSNIFSKPFADAPIVVVSSTSISNTNTKLIVNPVTTSGFRVYSDVTGTAYAWIATARTDYTFSFYNSVTPLPTPTLDYTAISFVLNTNSILRAGSPPYTASLKLDSPSTTKTININTGIQTITFTGLSGNTTYTFKIIAVDSVSTTITSSDQTFTTLQQLSLGAITTPTNDAGAGDVTMSAAEAATGGVGPTYTYTIQYKLFGSADSTYANGSSQTEYENIDVTNLIPGIKYTFRIKVVDSATPTGNIAYSTPLDYTMVDGLSPKIPDVVITIDATSVKADTFATGAGTLKINIVGNSYAPSVFIDRPGAPPYTVSIKLSYVNQDYSLSDVSSWTPNSLQHTFSGLYPGTYDIKISVTDSATIPYTAISASFNQANTIITGPNTLSDLIYSSISNTGTVSLKNMTGNITPDSGLGGSITLVIDFTKVSGGVPPYSLNISIFDGGNQIEPIPSIPSITSGTYNINTNKWQGDGDITVTGITGSTDTFSIFWAVTDSTVVTEFYTYNESTTTTNAYPLGGINGINIFDALVPPSLSFNPDMSTSTTLSYFTGFATGGSGSFTYDLQYRPTIPPGGAYISAGPTDTINGLTPATSYEVRYKATDNISGNSVYSSVDTQTTASVLAPVVITGNATWGSGSLYCDGTITSIGTGEYVASGICYSTTNTTPTLADTVVDNPYPPTAFPAIISATADVDPLTYYVRVFATNSDNLTGYGDVITVTTPTVTTGGNAIGGQGTITVSGTVTANGNVTVSNIGFYFGTNNPPTGQSDVTSFDPFNIPINFQKTIDDINPGTYYVQAFATNDIGIGSGNIVGPITVSPICLAKGTMIHLADMTQKPIEDITYADELLVWDFDEGRFANANPLWIKKAETTDKYNLLSFSDGSTLKTINQHRIFNKEAGAFTWPMTDATPLGTHTFNVNQEEPTLVSKEVVSEPVEFYNVITARHINLFANGILTSCRYNNVYPITSMKFVKDLERPVVDQANFVSVAPKYYEGLRLAEQTIEVQDTIKYIERLEQLAKV